jgi:hypothetical protein
VIEHGRNHRRSSEKTGTDGEAWLLKIPIKAEEEVQ